MAQVVVRMGKSAIRGMTRSTRNRIVGRENRIEEQQPTQSDLLGRKGILLEGINRSRKMLGLHESRDSSGDISHAQQGQCEEDIRDALHRSAVTSTGMQAV